MIKVYGSFLKHTIEPIVDKVSEILTFLESKGIPIDKNSFSEMIEKAFLASVVTLMIRGIFQAIAVSIVCFTVWMILHGRTF